MTIEGERVLVTGSGGFIGSHLVEDLVGRGARVRAFVRYTSGGEWGNLRFVGSDTLQSVEVVAGDLRDAEAVAAAVANCDVVFHLGALISIPYSYLHPREVIETNVMGTFNVLQAARRHSTRRVVQVSTSEVYGTARSVPMDESHPMQGQSPYSASKIGADRVAESFWRAFDVPAVTVRPFNTYGPRQTARAVIPTIISQALAGDQLTIGSLSPTRDFTFVTDTARGMRLAGEAAGVEGEEINLGNGAEISIGDLVSMVGEILGRPLRVRTDPARERPARSEVERLVADNGRARLQLGWQPEVTLREGLTRTVDWIDNHRHLFRPEVYER